MLKVSYEDKYTNRILEIRNDGPGYYLIDSESEIENYQLIRIDTYTEGVDQEIVEKCVNVNAFKDLEINLNNEDLWGIVHSRCKNEISKIDGCLQHRVFEKSDERLLYTINKMYQRNISLKGREANLNVERYINFMRHGNYVVTFAEDEEGIFAIRGYLFYRDIVILDLIIDKHRDGNTDKYRFANVWLSWKDINYFRCRNFRVLRFGGLGFIDSRKNTEEMVKIANSKERLIKNRYRKYRVYYHDLLRVSEIIEGRERALEIFEGFEVAENIIIYGYGMKGIGARIAALECGQNIVQIVDRYKYDGINISESITDFRGGTKVLITGDKSRDDKNNICLEAGYSRNDVIYLNN